MAKLEKGCIVSSRQGRDAGRFYAVLALDIDASRVLLVNGEERTLARPKAKNLRHIMPTKTLLPAGALESDLGVKTALRAFERQLGKAEDTRNAEERQEVGSIG